MTDTTTPEVDTRRFTPNQIAIACAKRLARYADFDENWLAIIVERGIELAEDGAFTITTEGGQTFHLAVTEDATQQAAQQREERAEAEARPHDDVCSACHDAPPVAGDLCGSCVAEVEQSSRQAAEEADRG